MIYYGEETAKALTWLGKDQTPRQLIQAYGQVKLAAICAQQETAALYPEDYFPLLKDTAGEIIDGQWDGQFPLPLSQGGAGTSLHMNICEVLANLANSRYTGDFRAHPLDHLARFQSTNDTLPTAVILMTYRFLERIEKQVVRLQEGLVEREGLYGNWLMCGRTELQDALPITLGQVFGAWAGPVERDRWRLHKVKERLRIIPLGGTALGTGFSAPLAYVFAVEKHLRRITGLPLCRSQNLCDQVAHTDSLAECANAMGLCADNLYKMSSDLLLYSSSLCREMRHAEVQFGSSIMPDKSNPVLLEWIRGLAMECSAVAGLVGQFCRGGQLQLNANMPFIAEQMLRLSSRLEKALDCTAGRLLEALQPDRAVMEARLAVSPALLNTLKDALGYSRLKSLLPLIEEAAPQNRRELALWLEKNTELKKAFLDAWADPRHLTNIDTGKIR
ncbi:MAG: lyase family protein [Desulforhopalus sp.]|nr:lyase family protein [Desulforhopalus sp.]